MVGDHCPEDEMINSFSELSLKALAVFFFRTPNMVPGNSESDMKCV